MITISLFGGLRDVVPKPYSCSDWFEFYKAALGEYRPTPCTRETCRKKECPHKAGPGWSPATFAGTRSKNNAVSASLLVYDLDHIPQREVDACIKRLEGYAYILLQTHSDHPSDRCMRLILRPSRDVVKGEFPRVWESVASQFELPKDRKSKDISRFFFWSRLQVGVEWLPEIQDGRDIDVDAVPLLDVDEPPAEEGLAGDDLRARVREYVQQRLDGLTSDERAKGELLARVLAGEALAPEGERDDSINRAVWILLGLGASREAVLGLLRPSVELLEGGWEAWGPKVASMLRRGAQRLEEERILGHTRVIKSPEEAVRYFNERYFQIDVSGAVRIGEIAQNTEFDLPELRIRTDVDLRALEAHVKVPMKIEGKTKLRPAADIWLSSSKRKRYRGKTVEAKNFVPEDVLNLWKGFSVEPKEGDWGLFKDLMRNVLCYQDRRAYEYLYNWTAWCIQNPSELAGVAVVLRGKEGTGKGTFALELVKAFGAHGIQISSAEHLVGRFNMHREFACLLFADEAFFAGSHETSNKLKTLITEEAEMREAKYLPAYTARNRLKIIMATNNEWAVRTSAEARRYFVLDVSDRRMQDLEYFGAIKAQMEGGGRAAMLWELSRVDLTGWERRKIPNTSGLESQKLASLDSFGKWIMDIRQTEVIRRQGLVYSVYGEHVASDLYTAFIEFCKQLGEKPVTMTAFGMKMRQFARKIKKETYNGWKITKIELDQHIRTVFQVTLEGNTETEGQVPPKEA